MPLAALIVITILAHSAFNGSRVTISLYALSLGASPLTVGFLISLYSALPMFLGVAAGRMIDRVGMRGPLMVSTTVLVAAVALPGIVPTLYPLYVAAACIGTSFMVFHISVQHMVGESSKPEDRRNNFGWLALGFATSNFIGPVFSGFCIDGLGHQDTFLLLSGFALAALFLLYKRRGEMRHSPHGTTPTHHGGALELLRIAELRRVFICTGLLASAWDLFVFAMPIYGTSIGLSASTIGLILGSFAAATFLVRLLLPWLTRRIREWTMIALTFAIAFTAYVLFPLVSSVVLLSAIAFLLGLGLGATQPSVMSLMYATAPEGRAGEAMGVRSTVLNVSHTILPLLFGGAGAALGMSPVFWTMAAFLAVGGRIADKRRREPAGP
ncbi:hypothetical protein BWI17_08995 [Betaproteobacteria bacterium GR16-43]|nr:hypothetical protein BWI17_08995 [Betaproteobacteria bacterium GR16-43]